MGKDLKNREIGKGLSQRKDGRYTARFVTCAGHRKQKYFDTIVQARNWLQDARYRDRHDTVIAPFDLAADSILNDDADVPVLSDMTVDAWFDFWTKNIIPDLRSNTLRNYRDRYRFNIQPVIGKLKVRDVRPLHCKKILLNMDEDYAGSTIKQTYITMGTLFRAALMNGLIDKHPMDGVRYTKQPKSVSDIRFLTVEEQDRFIETAKRSHNYNQYMLILETGIRTGELVGLTWDSVDLKNRMITIDKSLEYRHSRGTWEAGPPKTPSGYRKLPLTSKAYGILLKLYNAKDIRKESESLDMQLEFKDRITGEIRVLDMKNLVFLSDRTGMPVKNSSYDTHLYKLCEEAGIKPISMHVLRHTYATRAIERGVSPKALQKLLGHASLYVTMDTYVHVSDDSKLLAVRQFEGTESESGKSKWCKNGVNGVRTSEKMV